MSIDTSKVADSNTTTRGHGQEGDQGRRAWPTGPTSAWAWRTAMKKNLRKVFPDHWSFMLGEIALWSFVVLLLSGVFLTLWYTPSMGEVEYQGSYDPLRGVEMSEAYASTLKLSFDVRGGLLMRQMHHWAAMIFIASMMVHMLRVCFTGAFRKPRELNWVIGCLLLFLGTLEGFTGYSLPDDLLSGTGIRAADGFMKASPVVGSYMSFFLFGGEFPGESIIPRLFTVHVLLIPGLLLALIAAHMLLLVYHKHTQWPGPGRTEQNVVGFPMLPVYAAKAGGFFFIVFGVTALMGGAAVDQPGVEVRPLRPDQGHRRLPARLVHGLARRPAADHARLGVGDLRLHDLVERDDPDPASLRWCCSLVVMLLPFLDAWITERQARPPPAQRPRDAPTRTALMVSLMTFYGLAWAAGGNDIIAIKLHLSINQITYFMRAAVFIGPLIAFIITRRWCISLQRHDSEKLLHGYETGIIMRSAEGGYSERHLPISELGGLPAHGPRPRRGLLDQRQGRRERRRGPRRPPRRRPRASCRRCMYADNVQKPTAEELEEARHHAEHEHELTAALDGRAADGHQFDGHHAVDGESLRGDH